MTEEEILAKAYFVLGLETGSSMETVNTRWKRLVMVWHSDRFPTADGKKSADEELKKINDARDRLKAHFAKEHKTSGQCACNPGGGTSQAGQNSARTGTSQGPGPGKRRTAQESDTEETEAKRRSSERASKAAEQDAAQTAAAFDTTATQRSSSDAIEQSKLIEDERLRWKAALCLGAVWLGLSAFGFMGTGIKAWWHDVSWKWQQDHPVRTESKTNNSAF